MPGCQWVLLGTDGGLLEQAQAPMDEVFLAPAERVEVMVLTEGDLQGELLNRYYDREKMMVQEPQTDQVIAHMSVKASGTPLIPDTLNTLRSEERRVGREPGTRSPRHAAGRPDN